MLGKLRTLYKALYLKRLVKHGLTLGSNFQMEKGCNIDANFPWLVTIGNNVTFASHVAVIAHDGSTQKLIGYSKVGKVTVGDDVFVGYGSMILPNVTIGDGAIIGANSVVTKDVAPGMVAVGSPAREIMTATEFADRAKTFTAGRGPYGEGYLRYNITPERIEKMRSELEGGMGLIL